jgi:Septum formation
VVTTVAYVGLALAAVFGIGVVAAVAYALTPDRAPTPQTQGLRSVPVPVASPFDDPALDPGGATPSPTDAAAATLEDLQTGSCLVGAIGTGKVSVPVVVACTTPHRGQVYAIREAAGGERYPGETSMRKQADSLCLKADHNLVSRRPRSPRYIMWYPQADRWLDGDHRILCLVGTGSTTTTTSLVRPGST